MPESFMDCSEKRMEGNHMYCMAHILSLLFFVASSGIHSSGTQWGTFVDNIIDFAASHQCSFNYYQQ